MDFRSDRKKQVSYVIESLDTETVQKILRENGYHVDSHNGNEVRILIGTEEKNDVTKLLASHNVVLTGLYEAAETLEDTFLELIKD